MKKILLSGVLSGLLLVQACTSKSQTERTDADTASLVGKTDDRQSSVVLTDRLTALGLTADSHWRGINLGDPIATVRSTEKGTLFENDATHLGYTVEFPNLESADVLYRINARQAVNGIEVDLYLNNAEAVANYQRDLSAYFTGRYGQGAAGVWTGPGRETVTLKDVSKGKDYGLKIRIQASPAA